MNILLVDNGTLHLEELKGLLLNHRTLTTKRERLNISGLSDYDLIILGGSKDNSVVNNPKAYKDGIELIKTAHIPVIGICED